MIGAETQYYLDPDRFRLQQTLETFAVQLLQDLDGQRGDQPRTNAPTTPQGRPQP